MAQNNDTVFPDIPLSKSITRREFLLKSATGAVAATILVSGCASSGSRDSGSFGSIGVHLDWGTASVAKRVLSAPSGVSTVRVIVSAPDISPALQRDFSASAGAGYIDGIIAGSGRTLTVQGLDISGNVTYLGSVSNITILAGLTTNVGTVIMLATSNGNGVGAFNGTILLGSPTASSIKASIFSSSQSGTVVLQYGVSSGSYDQQSSSGILAAGTPLILALNGLLPDTRYYYRLYFQTSDGSGSGPTIGYSFRTARPEGGTFTFTIQADSHLDGNSDLNVYLKTLSNIGVDTPDFHIDMGDTFMCEKYSAPLTATVQMAHDQPTVDYRYRYERANFGAISHSVPLFLVNGNHEGEAGWLNDGTAQNIAIWTTQARQRYFLNPEPDSFYSGDSTTEPVVGKRASWYSWQWGSALFIVLDPFWNSMTQASKDPWAMTLGARQHEWLQTTLATSQATFKLVFIHNLVGGLDGQMRGGTEAAPYFEWGGKNSDETAGFSQKRPGWSMPIHQLLVTYGVNAVFHGHDHLYDKQVLDGIVYQEIPQPSAINSSSGQSLAAQYHYASGTILSSSGHMRLTVSPTNITAQYVRAWLPASETALQRNGQVNDMWSITA